MGCALRSGDEWVDEFAETIPHPFAGRVNYSHRLAGSTFTDAGISRIFLLLAGAYYDLITARM